VIVATTDRPSRWSTWLASSQHDTSSVSSARIGGETVRKYIGMS
jgi:hypothetical protein